MLLISSELGESVNWPDMSKDCSGRGLALDPPRHQPAKIDGCSDERRTPPEKRGSWRGLDDAIAGKTRVTRQIDAEFLDLPSALRRGSVEAQILDHRAADDDAGNVQSDPPRNGGGRQVAQRRDEDRAGLVDLGRLVRPLADRTVEIELARLEHRVEPHLGAEIDDWPIR